MNQPVDGFYQTLFKYLGYYIYQINTYFNHIFFLLNIPHTLFYYYKFYYIFMYAPYIYYIYISLYF